MTRTALAALALILALPLAACFKEPANEHERAALSEEVPEGPMFDNPFEGNASTIDNMTDVDGEAVNATRETSDATGSISAAEPAPPVIVADPEPRMSRPAGSCDDGKRVCGDMDSCEDAVFHLEQCGMSRLDGDSDGTPCEKICG